MPQTNSTVEERIVEMRFDNKQFESGVKQTMSTLDKLKEKLVFKNDVKGLDNIQNSINRIDLSVAMRGIDAFQQKLSALQIFGKRIVENLADDFYGAIKKVENGIRGVFQQISTGGANRALNIEQAKFQLEGLHIAWEDIKGDIDYAVSGTAYGLDAAAKVAAQLSASQIQVGDEMKNALRGISGVAAMTNSTYEDIGRVFTQVAGAGRLYTQDMLQLSSRGLNVAAALATQLGKTEGEIREMVTKGEIDFKTFSTAMNEAFGEQATKANDTYTGSLSNVKAALSRIGADIKAGHFETFRQVFVDLIPKLNEFKKAFKPVENVIIEVEAAIGKLLQKIISMVDVTKLVSRIAKPVEKIGKKILNVVDTVTAALEQVDAPLKAMKEFAYVSREAAMQMSGFGNAVKSTAKEEKEALNLTEDMQKAYQAAQDIWNSGKYGNGQSRVDALRAAGIDPDKTQQIIEEFIKNGGNWEEAIKKVSETTSEAVDENSEKAEKLTKKVQTLATIFRNIKRTFRAVAKSIGNIVSALFKSVTGSMKRFNVGDILISITGKIADLAEKFVITEEKAKKLTKPINVLLSVLKGIIYAGVSIAKFIGNIIINIGKLTYAIGKTVYESEKLQEFIASIKLGLSRMVTNIKKFIKTVKESEGIQKFINVLKTIGSTLLGFAGTAIVKIIDAISWAVPKIGDFLSKVGDFFAELFTGEAFANSKIGDFLKSIIDSIKTGNFIEELKAKFDFLGESNAQQETGTSIFTKIFGFIKGVFDWVVKMFDKHTLDEYLVVIKELISITTLLATMSLIKSIQKVAKNGVELLDSIEKVLKSTAKVNKSIANLNNAKAFAQIAKVILAFAASVTLIMFTVMKTADYISSSEAAAQAFEKAMNAVKEMMGKVFLSILGIIVALKSIDLAISMFTSKTKLHVPILLQFGVFMFSVGYAIKQIVKAMTDLYDMKDEVFQKGGKRLIIIAGGIGAFFAGLTLIVSVINKFLGGGGSSEATKGLYAMSLVLISMALSVDVLMAAVSWMSMMILGYGEDVVDKAVKKIDKIIWTIMGTLSLLIAAAGFFGSHTTDQDLPKMFASLAILFATIAVSMIAIMISVNDLTLSMKLFPTETVASFFMVWFFLESVLLTMAYLSQAASKVEMTKRGKNVIKSLSGLMLVLGAMVTVVGYFATNIKNDRQLYALVGTLSAITLIVAAMGYLVRNMGSNKLKARNIIALAGVFASLGVVIASLYLLSNQPVENIGAALLGLTAIVYVMSELMRALSNNNLKARNVVSMGVIFASLGAMIVSMVFLTKQPWENIFVAMTGLSLVVYTMSKLIAVLSDKDLKFSNILSLGVAFAGLATILLPLALLKGEDWPAYAAALGGLAAVVIMFGLAMKAMSASMPSTDILMTGVAFGIMAVGLAALATSLGLVSSYVDVDGLVAVTVAVGALATVLSLLGIAIGKIPQAQLGIGILTGAVVGITAAIIALGWWVSHLMERFPEFNENIKEFAYTLGQLPRIIVGSLLGKTKEELGINSPSTEFIKIGQYCMEGLFIGIRDALVGGIRKLAQFLKDYIITPVCEFFDINSPSVVFMKIGDFLGQGLINGFGDTIKNKFSASPVLSLIKDKVIGELPDFTNLGEGLGDNFLGGLTSKLENFNMGDLSSDMDFSQFSTNMGEAINETAVEGIQSIDPTTLHYAIEDLVNNTDLYNTLKAAFGDTGVVAAYDAMKEHEDFLAKVPTFETFKQNLKDYFEEDMANAFTEILNSGSAEDKEGVEAYLAKQYMDRAKLDNEVLQYSRAYKESIDKYLNDKHLYEITHGNWTSAPKDIADVVRNIKTTDVPVIVKVKAEDDEGNDLAFLNNSNSTVKLDYDNSSVKTNMDAVSGDISNAINAQTTKLENRLTAIENKVGTFDTNQLNRTNNLINRVGLLESAIRSMQLRLDTGALVGQLVGPMDDALGQRSVRKSRG